MLTQSRRLASIAYRQFGDTLGGMSTKYRFRDTYRIQLRKGIILRPMSTSRVAEWMWS